MKGGGNYRAGERKSISMFFSPENSQIVLDKIHSLLSILMLVLFVGGLAWS